MPQVEQHVVARALVRRPCSLNLATYVTTSGLPSPASQALRSLRWLANFGLFEDRYWSKF